MATATAKAPQPTRVIAQKLIARYVAVSQELDRLKAERKPLEEEWQELRDKLQDCANRAIEAGEFGDKSTIALDGGTFGYRQGPEKLAFVLDTDLNEVQRTAAIVQACKKLLPAAVKTTYDEKYLVRAYPSQPKLKRALAGIVEGVRRENQFIISLSK